MKRAKHNLSHYKLLTTNMGKMVPITAYPVVRGDSIRMRSRAMIRLAPMLAPPMHPVHVKIHHWFVPNRLTWNDWQKFITGGPDGNDSTVHPFIRVNNAGVGSLHDYLRVTPSVAQNRDVNALPYRALGLIWNNFYRDKDLQTERVVSLGNGQDTTTDVSLPDACWPKDYFTVARPEPQLGDETVIPVTGSGTVTTGTPGEDIVSNSLAFRTNSQGNSNAPTRVINGTNPTWNQQGTVSGTASDMTWGNQTGMKLPDNTEIGTMDVDDLSIDVIDQRLSNAIQRFKEARSKFGHTYRDFLAYNGIKSSDATLQLPQYLGGGKETIKFSEVLQTAPDTESGDSLADGVGNLYGHGINTTASSPFQNFFEEDGWVISVMIVMPITMYPQGIPRELGWTTKEDYFQKELAHIGQQEVWNQEVYSAAALPKGTFGWADRYDNLRRIENSIAGEFRTTLNYWHWGRIFESEPALNADFVKANPTNRVFASTATDQLYVYVRHDIHARRLVPQTGNTFLK